MKRCISPALKGEKPQCAWLHGKPGTGKTTVARKALDEFEKKMRYPSIYVNCWKHNTFYSVLDYIINEMKQGFGDSRDTSVKLGQFERLVKNQPCLIVLDEIDLVNTNERNDMIYNLHNIGKVGIICISESRSPILSLEQRIRSRINPRTIPFYEYTKMELKDILCERARAALVSGSWDERLVTYIATKAEGDARIAIQTLRNAANHASSDKDSRIKLRHVEKGYSDTRHLKRTYELKSLTEHHRLLFQIINDRSGINSSELFRTYIDICHERNWKPVAILFLALI